MSRRYKYTKDKYKNPTPGIYSIINLINGKRYIGSSLILQKRETEHFLALRKNKHPNRYLQFSYNKYGVENFKFEVVEILNEKDNLLSREQYWITFYNSHNPNGYNLSPFAISSQGRTHSQETKEWISLIQRGKKLSEETKKKMSQVRKGRKQNIQWVLARNKSRNETLKLQKLLKNVTIIKNAILPSED